MCDGASRPHRWVALLLVIALALTPSLVSRAEALSGSSSAWRPKLAGTISRANLDGTGKELSFIKSSEGACGVAVDASYIYWGTGEGVGRAKLDGTGVDERFITGASGCALAVGSGHTYWAPPTHPRYGPISLGIGRANLDGTGVNPNFIPGPGDPCGVAVDAAHVYWKHGLKIGRANLDGTGVERRFIGGTTAPATAVAGWLSTRCARSASPRRRRRQEAGRRG